VVIEWVDRHERIVRVLPLLDDLLPTALTTVEDVTVYRAALRAGGPFAAERSVGDYCDADVVTVGPGASVREVVALLLERPQPLLPVLGGERLLGVIASADLMTRAALPLPLRLLRQISPAERVPLLTPLAERTALDVMTAEPRSVYGGAPVPQALVTMLEWNYHALPVIDRNGSFAGLLDEWGVLRAARDAAPRSTAVRDAEPPTLVSMVMQLTFPRAQATLPLATLLAQMLAVPQRYLLLIDAAGRLAGSLSDADALARLAGSERAALLAALLGDPMPLPGSDRGPEGVALPPNRTLRATQTITEAVEYFVAQRLDRAPVLDSDGRLAGLMSRSGLLRSLAQAS
jgi:CBS-domain-containing membrane protein